MRQTCSGMRAWPEKSVSGGGRESRERWRYQYSRGRAREEEPDQREQDSGADAMKESEHTVAGPGQIDHYRR